MPIEHTIRADGFGKMETVLLNAVRAIRKQCRECYGFDVNWQKSVEECPSINCPLFPFRFGRSPNRPTSDRQREANRASGRRLTTRAIEKRTRMDAADGAKGEN